MIYHPNCSKCGKVLISNGRNKNGYATYKICNHKPIIKLKQITK